MDTTTIILIVLACVLVLIILLGGIYFVISSREKKRQAEQQKEMERYLAGSLSVPVTSMNEFMEFDEVKDNMIIRRNRTQYVMAIQCQGVNYDLLSEEEKLAVEEGFIQFLNTLRFPIQLYVQTRTLNLKDIIEEYRSRMKEKKDEIEKLRLKLDQVKLTGNLDQIDRLEFDIRRKENVFEYGVDISEYIARLSLNSNILQQKTYVIVSYYASEVGEGSNISKEELDSRCFSELYTRCQSVIRTLASAEVQGRILSSEELAELLYVAYNREDAENLQLSKVLDAEYDSLYNKGKDILLKRQEQLDEQIQLEAIDLATDSILEADRKRREKEELRRMEVQEKALNLLEQYKGQMDPELYEESTKEVKRRIVRKKKIQEQVADQDLASARAANGETVEQTTQENAEEKPKKKRERKPKKVSEEDENVAKEAM